MTRKKQVTDDTTEDETKPATAVAEPDAPAGEDEAQSRREWAIPFKAIFVSKKKGFEMGEDRRYGQRVFIFKEKPGEEVLATLKENGFTYRPGEKAWTIKANAITRRLSDELAREFAGQSESMSR